MIVELSGGLGNQMFEYAAARYVQLQNGDQMRFNLYPFEKDPQRNYSLGHFALDKDVSKLPENEGKLRWGWSEFLCHFYNRLGMTRGEESFRKLSRRKLLLTFDVYRYYPIDSTRTGYYWKGNFQSEKYFPKMKDRLRQDFTIQDQPSESCLKILNDMKKSNSVCVHIRRGDYVTNPVDHKILDICGETYYQKAMGYLNQKLDNPIFYIFSNSEEDLNWIKEHYNLTGKVVYVNLKQPDYMELMTMANCKHFIISNSTFSWWAQYLAQDEGKIVVAPSVWYNGDAQDAADIYQSNWHLIDVNGEEA